MKEQTNEEMDFEQELEKIEKKIDCYVRQNYDMTNNNIERKLEHTFRTKLVSDQICDSLNLSKRDKYLAGIIALFHDYARFEQIKQYNTFNDLFSFDHGDYAVKLLFEKDELKNFVTNLTEEERKIIYFAIKNHNKLAIQPNLTERENLFCKIIRDADKVDIFYIISNDFKLVKKTNGVVKKDDLENFYQKKLYVIRGERDFYDNIICCLSFVFDLNFKKSCEIILQNNYVKMYQYMLLLNINFKMDKEILKCFDFVIDFLKEKIKEE